MGLTDPKNLAPGHPERSLMYVRMNALPDDAQGKQGRMPPLASYVVDKGAVDLMGRWITSISVCP